MEFCPKCGAILVLKTKKYGCPRCNYSTNEKVNLKTSEKQEEKEPVGVVSSKEASTLPVVSETCKKCRNSKAYFWTVQTRASDESETKFFKCTKCENTWREYS